MRKAIFIFSTFFIVFSAAAHTALALSQTPPTEASYETVAVIDRVAVQGGRRFSEAQIRNVLIQQSGDEVNSHGVQLDLRAIAALYRSSATGHTEAWSGHALITSQVTVTPDIVCSSPGHVVVTYRIKEWFPPRD